jgi:hypothetical protein
MSSTGATNNGFHVIEVVARVWAVNFALAVLAHATILLSVANDRHYRLDRWRWSHGFWSYSRVAQAEHEKTSIRAIRRHG